MKVLIGGILGLRNTKGIFRSTLIMALKSARYHTGRDINTGKDNLGLLKDEIFDNDLWHSEYFTGLVNYLIILDQIGSLFARRGYEGKLIPNSIQKTLDCYTALSSEEKLAIRCL